MRCVRGNAAVYRLLVGLIAFGLLVRSPGVGAAGQFVTPSTSAKPTVVNLAPVAVSGELPGPSMWKVSKDGHTLWILGVVKPLPGRMQWVSAAVEQVVAHSQAVLKTPGMEIGAHVGFWGRLFLLPSMIGIKKLPEGKTLRDVLSPQLYRRWERQREKYLGGSWGVEHLRPIFAGEKLYQAAIKRSALTADKGVEDRVLGFAKANHVPVIGTSYVMIMPDPRADAKLFKQVSMDDQKCLGGIIDATEHDLAQATVRANAWAVGDVSSLRDTLAAPQQDECLSALGNTDFAKKLGMTDISERIRQAWLKAAEAALEKNDQSLALLPMEQVLAADGYLAALGKAGYTVTAPAP